MKEERMFGLVYRFGVNDYQVMFMDFSEEDEQILEDISMKYENNCTCVRGDKTMTLAEADCEFFD